MNDHLSPDIELEVGTTDDAASANATGSVWQKDASLGLRGALAQLIMARVQVSQSGYNKFGFAPYERQAQTSTTVILGHDAACVARTGDVLGVNRGLRGWPGLPH